MSFPFFSELEKIIQKIWIIGRLSIYIFIDADDCTDLPPSDARKVQRLARSMEKRTKSMNQFKASYSDVA